MIRLILAAAILAVTAVGCTGSKTVTEPKAADAAGETQASDFTGLDLEGVPFQLSKHLGKDVVLINFFASWCAPCRLEMPHLRKLYDANKARGFAIVAVLLDGTQGFSDLRAFWKRNDINFPGIPDAGLEITSVYNPKRVAPLSLLISRSGKVVVRHAGYEPGDEVTLAKDVEKLLVMRN